MKAVLRSTALAAGLFASGESLAGSPLIWQTNSLTYLWGEHFKVDAGDIQQTLTFEHASSWTWGDLFIFWDNKWFNGQASDGGHTYYGEITPRFSLGKIFRTDFSFGPVKDVLLATTFERGEHGNKSYLFGPGFDLKVPGFDYFQLNFYYRKPDGSYGNKPSGQWQLTHVSSVTLPVAGSDILIDGYIDWGMNDAGHRSVPGNYMHHNLHINPQIKYDLGKALSYQPKRLYVGIEYSYWANKYGIKSSKAFDTDESSTSLLLKMHF